MIDCFAFLFASWNLAKFFLSSFSFSVCLFRPPSLLGVYLFVSKPWAHWYRNVFRLCFKIDLNRWCMSLCVFLTAPLKLNSSTPLTPHPGPLQTQTNTHLQLWHGPKFHLFFASATSPEHTPHARSLYADIWPLTVIFFPACRMPQMVPPFHDAQKLPPSQHPS